MMLKINTNFKQGIGWSFTILTIFGLFGYLTFISEQTFAVEETRTLADINYMQEMNKYVCDNTKEIDKQYQLIDIRDGKKYWVAKHLDNNCWMTQNLDFDIPQYLDPATSDVTVGAANDAGVTVMDSKVVTGILGSATIDSWPTIGTDANFAKDYVTLDEDYIYIGPKNDHGYNGANNCTNVTSLTDSKCDGYFKQLNEYPVSERANAMHYHLGNYYSYSAATVGSADNKLTDGDNATMSICPRGWSLPTGGSGVGAFQSLMLAYGWKTGSGPNIVNTMNGNRGIYGDPLYFVYSGSLAIGGLDFVGFLGSYWSSTTRSNNPSNNVTTAYNFAFDSSVYPSNSNYRLYGNSVRCISNSATLTSDVIPVIQSDQSNLTITVSPTISLDVTADAIMEDATFTKVSTSNIVANVSSNYQYTVSLSTNQPNLELATPVSGQNIPMIKDGENVVAGTNGWGIMQKMSALDNTMLGSIVDNINNTYSPVGIGDEQIVFYKSAGPEALTDQTNPANPLTLKVGVGISPQLPQGTYSTTVTLTASTY